MVLAAVGVVIVIVLAILLQGGSPTTSGTPNARYSETPLTGGIAVTILEITRSHIPWDDVRIRLTDGVIVMQWSPSSSHLDNGSSATERYNTGSLGTVPVELSVTDLAGNGQLDVSDFFTVIMGQSSSQVNYTIGLIYEPTGDFLGQGVTFTH